MQASSQVLHEIGQYLKLPCTIILFLLMAVSVVELGYFLCEAIGRCKKKSGSKTVICCAADRL